VDLVDDSSGEIQATAAAGRLPEMAIDLPRAPKALGCLGADVAVPVTVADANVHGPSIYE
jgi:hypothetical protein